MSDLPDPEKVADKLKEISQQYHEEFSQDQHGWLNAADHYLRHEFSDK